MLAKPDPVDLPGAAVARRGGRGTARMFCDITMPDGSPASPTPGTCCSAP